VSKIWKVEFQAREGGGQLVENVLHVVDNPDTGTSEASASQVADDVYDRLHTDWLNCLSDNGVLDRIKITEVIAPGDHSVPAQHIRNVGAGGARSAGDNHLPPEMCAIIQLKTDAAVRSGRGWLFAPPARSSAALTSGGGWLTTNSYYLDCDLLGTKIATSWGVGTVLHRTYYFAVYSRVRHARGDDHYWFQIVTHGVPTKTHWLRSRGTTP
jgi:hypothetical protein